MVCLPPGFGENPLGGNHKLSGGNNLNPEKLKFPVKFPFLTGPGQFLDPKCSTLEKNWKGKIVKPVKPPKGSPSTYPNPHSIPQGNWEGPNLGKRKMGKN